MRPLLIIAPLFLGLGLAACTTGEKPSAEEMGVYASAQPVNLSAADREVILRDVRPALQNATRNGAELNTEAAEIVELSAVSSERRIFACCKVSVPNLTLETIETVSFSGEFVQKVMFVREFIGGNETEEAFVKRACGKRGMKLSRGW